MKKLILLMFVVFQFGMLQSVHAASNAVVINKAPDIAELARDAEATSALGGGSEMVNARHVVAPYAQVVPDASYTFIGVSHPSLATAHTSIGIVLEVLNMTTEPDTLIGRAAVFTVDAGETHRVFIVNKSHATINSNNASFTDSNTHIIKTADAAQFGSIKVTGIHTNPLNKTTSNVRAGGDGCSVDGNDGCYVGETAGTATLKRFDNVSQLAMWGVVYQSSNAAGFALEFIGDMHDSSALGTMQGGSCDGTPTGCGVTAHKGLLGTELHNDGTTFTKGMIGHSGLGRGIN